MSDPMLGGVAYVESLLRRAGEESERGKGTGGDTKDWPFSAGRDVVTRWVEDVLLGKVREKRVTYFGEECTMRKSDAEAGKGGLPKLVLFSTSSGEEKKGICLEEDLERRRRVKKGPFSSSFSSFEGEKASPPIVVYSSVLLSEVCSSILEEEKKGAREACLVVPQGKEVDSFSRRAGEEGSFFVLLSEEEEGNEDQEGSGRWRVYLSTSSSLLHVGFFSSSEEEKGREGKA